MDPDILASLSRLPADEISSGFRQKSAEFCNYIYGNSEPKSVGGIIINEHSL